MKTMLYEVWHFTDIATMDEAYRFPQKAIARWLHHPEQFVKVAEVEASDLGHVWEIAQNVNDSWTKRPEVKWSKSHEIRSTSVGDVVVQNGKAWLVIWEGFSEIPDRSSEARTLRE
jgi:hypothetical protein